MKADKQELLNFLQKQSLDNLYDGINTMRDYINRAEYFINYYKNNPGVIEKSVNDKLSDLVSAVNHELVQSQANTHILIDSALKHAVKYDILKACNSSINEVKQ